MLREGLPRASWTQLPPEEANLGEIFAMRPAEVFARVASDRIAELHEAYQAACPSCVRLVKPFEGSRELVLALSESGRFPSLVTNKGLERTLLDLAALKLDPRIFAAIVTAEDTLERKPNPAPLLLGLQRAGADAADAGYVGDGPQDIEAAHAAGLPAIAVTYGFYDRAALAPHNPSSIVTSVAELATILDVSLTTLSAP